MKRVNAILKKILPKKLVKVYINYQNNKNKDAIYFYTKDNLAYVYRKKQGLINHADEIETIALRGSTADCDFSPQCIKNSYNLGLTSLDVYGTYYLYLKSKEALPNLKNIIYYVCGLVPGMSLIKTREKHRAVPYKYFFDIPYQEEGLIDKKIEEKNLEECKKTKVYVPKNYHGYEKKYTFVRELDAVIRAKTILRENKREPDQMVWIKKIIDQIIEDKKNIYIVIPHYSTALENNLPPKEELYKKIYSLLSNYKDIPNVQLIDLYDSDLFDDSDMEDHDHYNKKGAAKSTRIIKEYIDKHDSSIKE